MIRRDLYALKVYAHDNYCVERIFRSRESARREQKTVANNLRRNFPLVPPIVVHPADWIVDAYLAAGNKIVD